MFMYLYRKAIVTDFKPIKLFYKALFRLWANRRGLEISAFNQMGGISIGSGSGLVNCFVHGPLEIGEKVMMGPDVVILTHTHNIDRTDIPMGDQSHHRAILSSICHSRVLQWRYLSDLHPESCLSRFRYPAGALHISRSSTGNLDQSGVSGPSSRIRHCVLPSARQRW